MAARRTTFGKMQRDRAKKARAAEKRERRQERLAEGAVEDESTPTPDEVSTEGQDTIIESLRLLHERFEDGGMSFDDFEEQKAALLARLSVD